MLSALVAQRFDPDRRGYHAVYRAGETNHCPGCSRTHWIIGRVTAECAFCSTALPLADATRTNITIARKPFLPTSQSRGTVDPDQAGPGEDGRQDLEPADQSGSGGSGRSKLRARLSAQNPTRNRP